MINAIMDVLDHRTVVAVRRAKANELLAKRDAHIAPSPQLMEVLEELYESEINTSVCLSSFWDDGWYWPIKLGDDVNGVDAEETFDALGFQRDTAAWLCRDGARVHPESKEYAARLVPVSSVDGDWHLSRGLRRPGLPAYDS